MRALLDVNVLLALFDPGHVHHQRAHAWWEHNQGQGWASCPLTQNGFVRVLSQPGYPSPLATSEALNLLAAALESGDHEFWPDEVSLLERGRFRRDRIHGPKRLTDLYLLGLATARGGRLATFDGRVPLSATVGAAAANLAVL